MEGDIEHERYGKNDSNAGERSDPAEKIEAEIKRLAENKEVTNPDEALIKAVKNIMDIDLIPEGTDAVPEEKVDAELSPDEMDTVAGGKVFENWEHTYDNDAQRQDLARRIPSSDLGLRLTVMFGDDFIDLRNKMANSINNLFED